jgi:hypothetical protein
LAKIIKPTYYAYISPTFAKNLEFEYGQYTRRFTDKMVGIREKIDGSVWEKARYGGCLIFDWIAGNWIYS